MDDEGDCVDTMLSDDGGHCDQAEAFTNPDMTERTMQISLDLSQATNVLDLVSTLNESG